MRRKKEERREGGDMCAKWGLEEEVIKKGG
jgi:hypothetical protein